MSSIGSPSPFFLAGKKAYQVDRSLRFNSADSAYLTRTPSSTGNEKVWTFSAWIKRTSVGSKDYIYSINNGNTNYVALYFQDDKLYTYFHPNNNYGSVSDRLFRDVGAWFHIVHQVDALNTTQKIWINGTELSLNSSRNPSNNDFSMNQSGVPLYIGKASWKHEYNNMYLAETYLSDGNKYQASDFGETDATTGQWIPKSPSISYGTNGFYLNFSDNSGTTATTLGKDSSGNGNNFTPNNFSVSAGIGNDSLEDTPTNNFCTLNPLAMIATGNVTPSNGNLDASFGTVSGGGGIASSFVVRTGKWYWETTITAVSGASIHIGILDENIAPFAGSPFYEPGVTAESYAYQNNGTKYNNNTNTSYGASYTTNDVIGIALDLDNGTITFYKNNVSQGQAFSGLTGGFSPAYGDGSSAGTHSISANFGQQGFTYTPPTGFKALNSANLPDPTILLPNKHFGTLLWTGDASNDRNITDANNVNFTPDWVWLKERTSTSFNLLANSVIGPIPHLFSNSTSAEETSITNRLQAFLSNGFQVGSDGTVNQNSQTYVGWNWNAGDTDGKTYTVKVVSDSGNKYRFDDFGTSAVTLDLAEGGTYIFDQSDSSNAGHPLRFSTTSNGTHGGGSEYTTGVTTSGTPGSSGAFTQIVVAASAPTLYYYCTNHSGMGGQVNTNSTLGSSNFDGSTQSTAKVNASAGFSIVTYTGTGSLTTLGHGLGVAPQVVITKPRSATGNWGVLHTVGDPTAENRLHLNDNDGYSSYQGYKLWGDTAPTSSVFTVREDASTNASSVTYVAYVLSEVAGYSKFGKYTGNGSSDGTFVFTGFRPAWIMIKKTSGNSRWQINDIKRNPENVTDALLFAEDSIAESASSSHNVDLLSNGFKHRNTEGELNGNGSTFIYLAFAEAPFKNARAR